VFNAETDLGCNLGLPGDRVSRQIVVSTDSEEAIAFSLSVADFTMTPDAPEYDERDLYFQTSPNGSDWTARWKFGNAVFLYAASVDKNTPYTLYLRIGLAEETEGGAHPTEGLAGRQISFSLETGAAFVGYESLYDKGIYTAGDKIAVPPGMTVTGPDGAVDVVNGQITASVAGEYAAASGSGATAFTVYTEEAFGRAVAPLANNQYASLIGQYNSSYGGFAFDAAAGAYRYVKNASSYTEYDPAKIICAASSVPGVKLLADHTEYSAFVFEIYYDDLNTDGKDLIFFFANAGFMRNVSVAQITETATSESVAYGDIQQDVWYTVSVPVTGSFAEYNGYISMFSAFGGGAYNFLVRNMRFGGEGLNDGYIYQIDETKWYELPGLGQASPAYAVTRDGGNEVTLTDGNKLKLTAAGEYAAVIGTKTIHFTVYTEDAFGAAVAPLTNGQYEGAFSQFTPSYGGFVFDAAAGAYRYLRSAVSYTVTFPPAIVCKTASVPGAKLLANNGGYAAFVFDICYNTLNASGKDLIFFGGAKYMNATATITKTGTEESVAYGDIQQGVWYTVSFPITAAFSDNSGSIYLFSAFGNDAYDFYVRNLRFGA
jgi:hypothetical protein